MQIYRQSYCRTRRRNGYLPFVFYFAHITATRAIDDDRANTAKFSNKSGLNSQYRPLPVSSLVLILPMLDAGVWHCDAFLCIVSWRSFVKIRQLMSKSARRQNYSLSCRILARFAVADDVLAKIKRKQTSLAHH
jgi:hypothetical protein